MRATRIGTVNERFNDRYEKDEATGCWNWLGSKDPKGYGRISGELIGFGRIRHMLVHRVSWLMHHGEIPHSSLAHGTVVMHACDNPSCVNPGHLRLGTQSDNVLDMIEKGRRVKYRPPKGTANPTTVFKDQATVDLICNTPGQTQELAERYGVAVSTIKRLRRRNGVVVEGAERFANKPLTQEAIEHIRSTKPGTRGLGKLYGVGKTTIRNIRRGLTHA